MKLSLVVPCYNEEENVGLFYDEAYKVFEKHNYKLEIVFVNDGSRDNSRSELERIIDRAQVDIKVVDFSRNFGKEAAMYAGLKNATGDYVAIIDADLQQDPKYVVEMCEFLDKNASFDCVAMCQEERKEGALLSFLKGSFYKLINAISQVRFVSGASDFRVFRRHMVDSILEVTEYYRFSKGIFSWVGYNTHYMIYEVRERAHGTTNWSFWKLFKYAVEGIVAFTTTPLRIATITGIVSALMSIFYLLFVIIQKLFFGIIIPGYATIVVLILLLGGLQLFALGIIGEYLARTYMEVKKRPIYIARDILSNKKGKVK